jgi:RNA polymerase-binding transcription factor DksA
MPGPASLLAGDAGRPPRARLRGHDVSRLGRQVVAERQALAEIEAALDRIATGQYGRCEQCHQPISAGLLARRPEARFCAACSRRSAPLPAYA